MHIVILDTDQDYQNSLSATIREVGHSVETPRDNEEALGFCSPGKSDLLILDSNPEMLARVKDYNPELSVIVTSRNPTVETVVDALRLGACDFFTTPITEMEQFIAGIELVRHTIEAASNQRAYLNRILKTFSELSIANEGLRDHGFTNGTTELYYNQYFEDILSIELARSQLFDHGFTILSVRLNYLLDCTTPETDVEFRAQIETISDILHQRMRRTDIVIRTGVTEFMAILVETPKQNSKIVIDSLYREIAAVIPAAAQGTGDAPENSAFAIGAAAYPIDGIEYQELMEKARQNY
jgi:diguanylate cyclase (GGDEF)-like protein